MRSALTRVVGVDDIAFHRRLFELDRVNPATVAALLWELQRGRTDRATVRVAGWTRSLLGMGLYRRQVRRRGEAATRLAGDLSCPRGTLVALAAVGEYFDGGGFPDHLAGERIPIAGRILAAAQSAVIWGEAAAPGEVGERLARQAGGRFDPAVVREIRAQLTALPSRGPAAWLDDLAGGARRCAVAPVREQSVATVALTRVFAEIVDAKSPFTASHSRRVAALAGAMAHGAGDPAMDESDVILAGLLHDLGKLAVPNRILDKDGPLDEEEWTILRRHPADSARVIAALPGWATIATWAGAHHERVDGGGYHQGLKGAAIAPAGRVLAVADAFDAMTADRPYRAALPVDEALRRLRAGRGSQFDPAAVAFLEGVVGMTSDER
ncbi:MAG TPA: HD domain-containing phosphohydrolase [Thermomicrobiales bacterium]|nr:HD domain-containing phosphohydrolase [Thermomicrobiales bacterium]